MKFVKPIFVLVLLFGSLFLFNNFSLPTNSRSYKQSFTCGVTGNRSGCFESVSCSTGYRITSAKAVCNLERSSRDKVPNIDEIPENTLVVSTQSDNTSLCFFSNTSIKNLANGVREPSSSLIDIRQLSQARFGCREGDEGSEENGGDCRIVGEVVCSENRDVNNIRDLKLMTFNIHHGRDRNEKSNLDRIVVLIKSQKADVIALQEVDKNARRSGRIDQAKYLADKLGFYYVFEKNLQLWDGGDYGNAILSRYPIADFQVVKLPPGNSKYAGANEPRSALVVRVIPNWEDLNRDFVFVSTHLGVFRKHLMDYENNYPNEITTVDKLVEHFELRRYRNRSLILAGDINSSHDFINHNTHLDSVSHRLSTYMSFIDPRDRSKKHIDYIMLKDPKKSKARYKIRKWDLLKAESSGISDHFAKTAELSFE